MSNAINIRLSKPQRVALERAAKTSKLSLTAWAREMLLHLAGRSDLGLRKSLTLPPEKETPS